jgi:hypothetical protein
MLLAELEVRHSRAIAPTRRVALGEHWLPTHPAPGFGGILLGGLVAAHIGALEADERDELDRLLTDLEVGRRVPQPRLRHRLQTDLVGLDRSRHRLVGRGQTLYLEIDDHGLPAPQLLAAVYAAGRVPLAARTAVFETVRRATRWHGPVDDGLIRYLMGRAPSAPSWRAYPTDERWALTVLGFGPDRRLPNRHAVQRRFRALVRQVHPDHGAEHDGAGQRMVELTEARRILLG